MIYKRRTGYPKSSHSHETEEGFKLGVWQKKQQDLYNDGKLDLDKIKRLEDIGFKWALKK